MPVVIGKGTRTVRIEARNDTTTVQLSTKALRAIEERTATVVERDTRVTQISSPGVQGPAGADGVNGAGLIPPINVAWGDASPRAVHTVAADALVDLVQLTVETAYDGASPSFAVGTLASPSLLMPASYNDLTAVGTYEASPDRVLTAGTVIYVTQSPGAGASAGAGRLQLSLNPL